MHCAGRGLREGSDSEKAEGMRSRNGMRTKSVGAVGCCVSTLTFIKVRFYLFSIQSACHTWRVGPTRKHMLPIDRRLPRVKHTANGAGLPSSSSVRRTTEKLHVTKAYHASHIKLQFSVFFFTTGWNQHMCPVRSGFASVSPQRKLERKNTCK